MDLCSPEDSSLTAGVPNSRLSLLVFAASLFDLIESQCALVEIYLAEPDPLPFVGDLAIALPGPLVLTCVQDCQLCLTLLLLSLWSGGLVVLLSLTRFGSCHFEACGHLPCQLKLLLSK